MAEGSGVTGRAGDAVARGAWGEALALLREVRAARELSPAELELLARAAYGAGELEEAVTAWERAHRELLRTGDPVLAARAAVMVAMHLMMDTGLMAPVRGWLSRAGRLLEGHDEQPVHAWWAMVGTYERLLSGDPAGAARWADQAVEAGRRQDAAGPVAVGQVAQARVRILAGDVPEGLAQLDEAAVTVVSDDLDPLTAGIVYCELICAMQGLAQYDRAEQWTDAMERWRRDHAVGAMGGRCRVHRAEILRLRGSCEQAEAVALQACEELRPWMRRELGWPLTELGTIRLRRGDLAGAEQALLAAHECGWDPQPGLALVRLAQGEVEQAAALVRGALEHPPRVPSKERPPYGGLPRAPLLEAQVEIEVAAGRPAEAGRAAAELEEIAATYRSRALTAAATLARGRVALANGDPDAAAMCDQAVAWWSELGAPYEAAVARTVLAGAYRAGGAEGRAQLELRAARATFARIGADPEAATAATAGRTITAGRTDRPTAGPPDGPTDGATGRSRAAVTSGVFRRDGDLRTVAFAGSTVLMRDLKGMRYLARMLTAPGREFHALDLLTAEHATPAGAAPAEAPVLDERAAGFAEGGTGPVLDDRAVRAYKRRLAEIDEDLDEATRTGDTGRAALARADRDFLVAELSRAFGLGGRHRPTGSTSERARVSVTRALRYALGRIREHHPALATHLRHTVRTGTYCCYAPDPTVPTSWTV